MINSYDTDEFMTIVKDLTYKSKDVIEAIQFGNKNVYDVYEKSNHEFAKYYTISHDGEICITIMLQRDGILIYFVTNKFNSNNMFYVINDVKKLANDTLNKVDTLLVTTADFYNEAKRFVRLIGFKPYKIHDDSITWLIKA